MNKFLYTIIMASLLLAACGTPTAAAPTSTFVAPTTVASATETVTPMPSPSETPIIVSAIQDITLSDGIMISMTDPEKSWIILVGPDGEAWACKYTYCQNWTITDRSQGNPDPTWIIIYDRWSASPGYEIIEIQGDHAMGRIEQDSWIVEDGRFKGVSFEVFLSGGSTDPVLTQRYLDLAALAENGKLCATTDLSPIFRCTPAP